MKCCEKWSNLDNKIDVDIIHKTTRGAEEHFFSNDRFKYCPECGSKLESECKHPESFTHDCGAKYVLLKPKSEYCECECSVRLKHDLRKDDCLTCHKPIKPKRELPEKFSNIEKDLIGDRLIAPIVGKIEEILDYLK